MSSSARVSATTSWPAARGRELYIGPEHPGGACDQEPHLRKRNDARREAIVQWPSASRAISPASGYPRLERPIKLWGLMSGDAADRRLLDPGRARATSCSSDDGAPKPHVRLAGRGAAAARDRRRCWTPAGGATRSSCSRGSRSRSPASDGERRDRPFPLDLVPRVLTADEWTVIKRGLAQRIRALNAFVDDVYHAREIVRAGIVPWSLIVSRPELRAAGARRPRARRRLHATSAAVTSCAAATAPGGCSRTTCARRRGSPTCSRTGWR